MEKNIEIGRGTFLNTEIRFGVSKDNVISGDLFRIDPRVMFETVNHSLKYEPVKGRGTWTKPIVVEDGAWIAGGVIITQGVTMARGSVVAAGEVVTKDVEENTVVGGVPAKQIHRINVITKKHTLMNANNE